MSRTCTRVLAAVLMTGGIATALALPALVKDRPDEPRAVLAPPSSLERIVHIHTGATSERPNPKNTGTHVSISRRSPAFASVVIHRARHANGPARPQASGAAPVAAPVGAPGPTPAPAPPVKEPPAAAAAAAAPAQAAPAAVAPSRELASSNADESGKDKGNGKAKGHDKQKAKAALPPADDAENEPESGPAPIAPAPSSVPAEDANEGDASHGDAKDNGKGHGDHADGDGHGQAHDD